MKDASQFPVSFPYGAVDEEFYGKGGSVGTYHRGDDRAMPINTPVIINGNTTVGFSGSQYGGAHLHIGRFVNGKDTNPNGQGFTLKSPAKVTGVFEDATNGKYVSINDADGVRWVYLHLQSQTATIGQIINEEVEVMDETAAKELWRGLLHREPENDKVWRGWVGKKPADALLAFRSSSEWLEQNRVLKVAYPEAESRITELAQNIRSYQAQKVRDDKTIGDLEKLQDNTKAAISKAQSTAPAATKQPYFVNLVKAILGKQ